MVAFEATISDPEAARPDGDEIEEIRWFDHDSILRAVQEGTLLLPPSMSVARAMINAWYGDDRPPLETPETWRN
jgi:NAD+ diphosphatase